MNVRCLRVNVVYSSRKCSKSVSHFETLSAYNEKKAQRVGRESQKAHKRDAYA